MQAGIEPGQTANRRQLFNQISVKKIKNASCFTEAFLILRKTFSENLVHRIFFPASREPVPNHVLGKAGDLGELLYRIHTAVPLVRRGGFSRIQAELPEPPAEAVVFQVGSELAVYGVQSSGSVSVFDEDLVHAFGQIPFFAELLRRIGEVLAGLHYRFSERVFKRPALSETALYRFEIYSAHKSEFPKVFYPAFPFNRDRLHALPEAVYFRRAFFVVRNPVFEQRDQPFRGYLPMAAAEDVRMEIDQFGR